MGMRNDNKLQSTKLSDLISLHNQPTSQPVPGIKGNRRKSLLHTFLTVSSSKKATKSQSTFPCGVCIKHALCPIPN